MKRIIIVEGPDNIGKSTLCQLLTENIPHSQLRHFGPPTEKGKGALREQLATLKREVVGIVDGDGIEVWDRSIIGEMVYGPLYRTEAYNHQKYRTAMMEQCEEIMQRCYVIVLYTNGEWYRRMKIQKKGDERETYQQQDQASKIATAFVDVVTDLPFKHRLFINCENYTSFNARNNYIRERVRQWLKHKPYEYWQRDDYTQTFFSPTQNVWMRSEGFIGKWNECGMFSGRKCTIGQSHRSNCTFGETHKRPTTGCGALKQLKYIFVGEAPGHKGCGKLGIPFYNDASGNLLQEALDALYIAPTEYYMTNVVKCCPLDNKLGDFVSAATIGKLECVGGLEDEINELLDVNPRCKVVAIGKVAARELAKLKIDHVMSYHPAYYLRIGQRATFAKDLRKVILGV